jgi:hypothetical protein
MFKFGQQKSIGDKGENKIYHFLHDHDLNVEKISFDYNNPGNGDLLIRGRTKNYVIEVKTDLYVKPRNFFLETSSNHESGTPGCIEASKSDFLFYYFINERELYIFKTSNLKKWLARNKAVFINKNVKNKGYTTRGIPVDKRIIIDEVGIYNFADFLKEVS